MADYQVASLFSTNWYENLLEQTNELKRAALITNALFQPIHLYEMLKECINAIGYSGDEAIIRLFVDNAQRFDLLEKIYDAQYDVSMDLETWISDTIGYREFCMTINGLTKWHEQLHIALASEVITPIINKMGNPLGGTDVYAFIANSGTTPFGIHNDSDHTLIFHLGPNEKEVWIWDNNLYRELTGSSRRRFDLERIQENALHFVMKPGDCLFIPKGDFHIFQNNGYSAFIGFNIFPSGPKRTVLEAINTLAPKAYIDSSFITESEITSTLTDSLNLLFKGRQHNTFEMLEKASNSNYLLLKSNAFAIHKTRPKKVNKEELTHKLLKRPSCFPVLLSEYEGNLILFIRGHSFEKKMIPGLLECMESINNLVLPQKYEDLIANMTTLVPLEVADELIDKLIEYRGLQIVTGN